MEDAEGDGGTRWGGVEEGEVLKDDNLFDDVVIVFFACFLLFGVKMELDGNYFFDKENINAMCGFWYIVAILVRIPVVYQN